MCDCRFASLYFIISIDKDENELMALEFIQHYVEVLDQYYGNVQFIFSSNSVGL